MSAFLTSRLAIGLLALFSLLTTVALTIGGISLTRAGIVSVLPVTSQQSGITVCGHGKATAKPDQRASRWASSPTLPAHRTRVTRPRRS